MSTSVIAVVRIKLHPNKVVVKDFRYRTRGALIWMNVQEVFLPVETVLYAIIMLADFHVPARLDLFSKKTSVLT